jgi:hypothetical protein
MPDSDNGDYLSDGAEEIEATMGEAQSEQSVEKDEISMQDGSSSSPQSSRPTSVIAGRKSGTTDELVAGAEAISSDEQSDAEDGEIPQSSQRNDDRESPKSPDEFHSKKQKTEPREDLEDGEIESDSEDEEVQPPQQQQQYQTQQPKPLITPPFRNNTNRQFNIFNNRPKVDFPRQQNQNQNNNQNNKRKRPEDCGVCKFFLRGNCTWNDKCKYNHPLGGQRIQWLADLGLPDPEIGYNPNRPRRTDNSKQTGKSNSPKDKHSLRIFKNNRQNGEKTEAKKSPRASPISSDESRSPSPKRIRQSSPTAISVSSDSRPPSRARSPSLSPQGKRRIRSSSSESSRSRSRSPHKSITTDTTLGALLRKRRLESQTKQGQDSQSSFLPGNISDSDDDDTPAPPKNRAEAVRRFFNRDPNDEPAVYKQPSKLSSPPHFSPTPQSISSSEDERDRFESPSRESIRSPSPAII